MSYYERHFEGSKLEQSAGKDVKEIAKEIRKDIKEAIKTGHLPQGLKVSVTIERFSGGQSIDANITDYPYDIKNPEFDVNELWELRKSIYNDVALEDLKKVEDILQAYNYDSSDPMTDYFDVRYYGHAKFDYSLTK